MIGWLSVSWVGLMLHDWLVVFTVGWTGAYAELVKKRPSGGLVTAANITSLLIHVATVILIQSVSFVYLQSQPW